MRSLTRPRRSEYDADREAYEAGTWWVAFVLGFTGLMVVLGSPLLYESINREEMSVARLAGLGAAALLAATVSSLVPGVWRLVGIAVATVPLLLVVAAYSNSA
jgi:hypothetical protein